MNEYSFDAVDIGTAESFRVTISDEMLERFRLITGDINPLHCDPEFAVKMGHVGCVAYGMLTASFLSTLAGVYLPGRYSLIHSVEVNFSRPVYVGDEVEIKGTCIEKDDRFQTITLRAEIRRGSEKVLRGKMTVGFLKENNNAKE